MTFSEWFEEFHETYCKGVLSHDCAYEYNIINKKHFYPIADMELDSIKPIHIQKCLNTATEYSSSRQRKVYYLVKRCFNEAIVNEYCEKNPAEKIKSPKRIRKNITLLTSEQLRQLFEVETEITRMFKLELWTGLRRGEILALTWSNVHFEDNYINVCQTLVNASPHAYIRNSTKSNSDRQIPLCSESRRILNDIKAIEQSDSEYVFHNAEGRYLSFRAYHDRYKAFFKERQEIYPDIPYTKPHQLRHAYATYILQNGADIETARMLLGHANISTTQIYVHSSFEKMQAAADRLKFD